jgi:cation:H+ antiporter
MDIFLNILLLTAGLTLIIKGADFLVDGSTSLAIKMGVPQLVVGLTVVAFGINIPELFINLNASLEGRNEALLANILSGNIYNILLVLGVASIITPLSIKTSTKWREIPMALGSVILIFILANTGFTKDLIVTRLESLILLIGFAIFMWYTIHLTISNTDVCDDDTKYSSFFIILSLLIGFAALIIGQKFTKQACGNICESFNFSEKSIALIGIICMSLPTLATSATAAYKKQSDLAIASVIGSNIFNMLFVSGISCVVTPIAFSAGLNIDILILATAMLFLFAVTFIKKENIIGRQAGIVLLCAAVIYTIYLIFRG